VKQRHVAAGDFAHAARVEGVARGGAGSRDEAVAQRQAHGLHAARQQQPDQSRVHLAGQHAGDLIHVLWRRQADALALFRHQAQLLQLSVDRLAAAVHQHRWRLANARGQRIEGGGVRVRLIQQRAAKLDHHGARHCSCSENSASRPMVSGRPKRTFMHCTAWPLAPFTRLSMLLTSSR
jgi:hypothetical protein